MGSEKDSTWDWVWDSPHASFDWENRVDEDNIAVSVKFLIGYGIDNNNVIAYQALTSGATSKRLNETLIFQGLFGPRWFHYFGTSDHNRFFGSAGIGWLRFGSEYSDVCGSGLGYEIGLGHEILHNLQFELFYIWGETESVRHNRISEHSVLSLLLSAYAF